MNKPPYPHPIIAREGWPFLAGAVVVAILITLWSPAVSIIFWIIALFVLQFFRDPPRMAPDSPAAVLSPADGRVVAVETVRDPCDRDALKISVFMNVFNVHSNRAPVNGQVMDVQYFPGKFFSAALDKASLENERNAMVLRTPAGHAVTAVQVAGLVPSAYFAMPQEERYAGARPALRDSSVSGRAWMVYLQPAARPRVALGDKVSATSSVLADWPATDDASHA